MTIKLDGINAVNVKEYRNEKEYHISFLVSNAINPVFSVWSEGRNTQEALNMLGEYLKDNKLKMLYYDENEISELCDCTDYEINVENSCECYESVFQCDNGINLDMERMHVKEL